MPQWTQHISLKQMIIGASKNKEGQFYNGLRFVLDELTIWKKTLSQNEIQEQYMNGFPLHDLSGQEMKILAKQ